MACLFCIENAVNNNLCEQCNQVIQFFNLDGPAQEENVYQVTDVMGNLALNAPEKGPCDPRKKSGGRSPDRVSPVRSGERSKVGTETWNSALKQKLIDEKTENKDSLINSMKDLENALASEDNTWVPQRTNIFKAFKSTSLHKVKAVIIGQEPSATEGLHTGLAFSLDNQYPDYRHPSIVYRLNANYMIMRALQYEYKIHLGEREFWTEVMGDFNLNTDIDRTNFENRINSSPANNWPQTQDSYRTEASGNLEDWADKGFLLLNRKLTFQSQVNHRWIIFTQKILEILKARNADCPVIYFGNDAWENFQGIGFNRVIKAFHPTAWTFARMEGYKSQWFINFISGIRERNGQPLGYFKEVNGFLGLDENEEIAWINKRWNL